LNTFILFINSSKKILQKIQSISKIYYMSILYFSLPRPLEEYKEIIEDLFKPSPDHKYLVCQACGGISCQYYPFLNQDIWLYCESCGSADFITAVIQKKLLLPQAISGIAHNYYRNILPTFSNIVQTSRDSIFKIKNNTGYENIADRLVVYDAAKNNKNKTGTKSEIIALPMYIFPKLIGGLYDIQKGKFIVQYFNEIKNLFLFSDFTKNSIKLLKLTNSTLIFLHDPSLTFIVPVTPHRIDSFNKFYRQDINKYYDIDDSFCTFTSPADIAKFTLLIKQDKELFEAKSKHFWQSLDKKSKSIIINYIDEISHKNDEVDQSKNTKSEIIKIIGYGNEKFEIYTDKIVRFSDSKVLSNFVPYVKLIVYFNTELYYLLGINYNNGTFEALVPDEKLKRTDLDKLASVIVLERSMTDKIKELPIVLENQASKVLVRLAFKMTDCLPTIKFDYQNLYLHDIQTKSTLFGNGLYMNNEFYPSITAQKNDSQKIHYLFDYDSNFTEIEYLINGLTKNDLNIIIKLCEEISGKLSVPGYESKPIWIYTSNKENFHDLLQEELSKFQIFILLMSNPLTLKAKPYGLSYRAGHELVLNNRSNCKILINKLMTQFYTELHQFYQSNIMKSLNIHEHISRFHEIFWRKIRTLLNDIINKNKLSQDISDNPLDSPVVEWKPQKFIN
jgi:hypothetical protein